MIRKKKSKAELRKSIEKDRRYLAMKGGPTKKEKETLRKKFKNLRRQNPRGDIRIGTSTYCGISAMVANDINNGLGGPFISIACDDNKVIWKYGIRDFAKIEAGSYGNKVILKSNKGYIGETNKKLTDVKVLLHDAVVEALEKSRKIRKNPFTKNELFIEIRKHLKRKPPEIDRALVHLKELEDMLK